MSSLEYNQCFLDVINYSPMSSSEYNQGFLDGINYSLMKNLLGNSFEHTMLKWIADNSDSPEDEAYLLLKYSDMINDFRELDLKYNSLPTVSKSKFNLGICELAIVLYVLISLAHFIYCIFIYFNT